MAFHKYFTVSFDDGLEQDKKLIKLMKQYGISGTFNLNAGLFGERKWLERSGEFGYQEVERVNPENVSFTYEDFRIPADEIAQVYEGFEVASHGYRHECMTWISEEQMRESIQRDVQILSAIKSEKVTGFAYPFGAVNDDVIRVLKQEGIGYARLVQSSENFDFPEHPLEWNPTCWLTEENVMERLEQFITTEVQDKDMLFCLWGHGYELDFGTPQCSWDQIERIFDKIAGKSDIIYCTNRQAFENHQKL